MPAIAGARFRARVSLTPVRKSPSAIPRSADRCRSRYPPRAALTITVDGIPSDASHSLRGDRVHRLQVDARVFDWPPELPCLTVHFRPRTRTSVDLADIELLRPPRDESGLWVTTGAGSFTVRPRPGEPPDTVLFDIDAELSGQGNTSTLELFGTPRLELRSRESCSGRSPALDTRLAEILAKLDAEGTAPAERDAFARFLAELSRAGDQIQADREFPEGAEPTEGDFQREMCKRLKMTSALGGRVIEHSWQGGGATDLVHDGVVAELKIAKDRPVTAETAIAYLGQTTQYASGGGRQLSILVILDMTRRDAPPGVLANDILLLEPRLSGLSDPAFPSRVAAVILRGNLPVPGKWSSTQIPRTYAGGRLLN